jgi:hypothetical protein
MIQQFHADEPVDDKGGQPGEALGVNAAEVIADGIVVADPSDACSRDKVEVPGKYGRSGLEPELPAGTQAR